MNKTSYQVSDASIKRYWKLRKPKTIEGIEANEKLRPIEIFHRWCNLESFYSYTKWEALEKIAQEDYHVLKSVIFQLREKTEKLNKIAEAFEIINELDA
tara:strand:+ start:77 stop:373 length:297 start_codon:yes stop_codon:yes gene_type:complete